MSETSTIERFPADLKRYWAREAERQGRSLNDQVLRVLQDERRRRQAGAAPGTDLARIIEGACRLQGFALIDERSIDEILYDR